MTGPEMREIMLDIVAEDTTKTCIILHTGPDCETAIRNSEKKRLHKAVGDFEPLEH